MQAPEKVVAFPKRVYRQQGDLILLALDEIPRDAVADVAAELRDGGISLGGGHIVRRASKDE
jgi:hypothetical protein